MPQARAARSPPTRSGAGSITSRSAPDGAVAWSAGKPAFAQSKELARIRRRPRPSAASPFCRKAFGSRSRTTTARRCGFRMRRRRRRKCSNGRARISARQSVPTAAFWSRPCRSRCCTAGGSPTRKHMRMSGYAARVTLAWLDRRRQLARDLRRASSSSSGRSRRKTGRWARSRAYWRRRSTVSRSSPATRSGTSSPPATPTAWCCIVRIEDGAEILAKNPGEAPASALAWSADGMLLAFGTENGEAGVIDLA